MIVKVGIRRCEISSAVDEGLIAKKVKDKFVFGAVSLHVLGLDYCFNFDFNAVTQDLLGLYD